VMEAYPTSFSFYLYML